MKIYIQRLSRRLKSLREEKDLTQEELANRLGISRQSIISVEKGKCLPSLPLALRIAEIFEKSLEDLFFNEPKKKGGENMTRFITPWSPFGDLDRFFEDEDFLPRWPWLKTFQFPMVNVKQSDKEVTITADIPGIKEEDVNVEIGDDFVNISGERKEEEKHEGEGYFHQEVRYGSFARRVPLPTEVVADKAEATIKDGQLKLVIPKLEPEKPKVTKIKVKKG
jgi:HSP20 family protein